MKVVVLLLSVLCLVVVDTKFKVMAMATPTDGFTAIVIGAGPAGLAASLGLSCLENCKQVLLVEKHKTFDARGANFLLACNGLKALEEMSPGIQKDFERVGIVSNMVPEYPAILLPWWEMRDVLLERVRQMPKVKLFTGKRLNLIENEQDGVCVRFENDDELVLKGDLLIGADGVNSVVRQKLDLPQGNASGVRTVFRGHVNNSQDNPQVAPLLEKGFVPLAGNFGINGVVGSVFNYDAKLRGKLAWVVGSQDPLVEGETTALSILDPSKSKLEDQEDLNMFRALIDNTEPSNVHVFPQGRVMDFSQEILDGYNGRWGGKGRVTLVGDAAHAFPSADGQGGSQAFEDARVLARLLKGSRPDSIQDILAEFEKLRVPRVKKLHDDQTERFTTFMSGTQPEPWSPEMMEWVFEGV